MLVEPSVPHQNMHRVKHQNMHKASAVLKTCWVRTPTNSVLHLCVFQEMMWAARRTARCTPTGTSGSRSHAGSVCVTTVRSSATSCSVMIWLTVRRWSCPTASAALFVSRIRPPEAGRNPSVSEQQLILMGWFLFLYFAGAGHGHVLVSY